MGGHHHAAQHALGSHRHLWAVVETAHHLAFWTLLDLIGGQVQARLDERMIEDGVLFASCHKSETSQVGEDGSGPILAIEPEQGTRLWKLMRREVARDGRSALSQFLPVAPVASVAKRAEPLEAVGLADDGARPHHLPALAAPVARGTDLIQPAKGRRQVFGLGQGALAGGFTRAINDQRRPRRCLFDPPGFRFASRGESGRLSRSSRKSVRRASTGASVNAAKKRERVERAGSWSRSNKAMKGTAKGWSRS